MHAELVGIVDGSGEATRSLADSGMTMGMIQGTLESLIQGQSVMLATNGLMAVVAVVFVLAAVVIWIAPRPTRAVDMTKGSH